MKAAVYHGPGERSWEEVPDPQLQADTDVIVGIDAVTICGTDLHILKGDVPEVTAGTILGHEAVGTVEEVGSAVRSVSPGDHVLVSCISGCGTCRFCREGHYGQCIERWRLGAGTHHRRRPGRVRAGSVRRHVPLPTASRRQRRGRRALGRHPADQLRGRCPQRRRASGRHGRDRGRRADRPGSGDDRQAVLPGLHHRDRPGRAAPRRGQEPSGADVVLDAGARARSGGRAQHDRWPRRGRRDGGGRHPRRPSRCARQLVRPGGRVANIGVHGAPATIHLETLWIKNVTITTGLVDTSTHAAVAAAAGRPPARPDPDHHPPVRRSSGSWRPTTSSAARRRPAHSRSSCSVADSHVIGRRVSDSLSGSERRASCTPERSRP